MKIKVKVSGPYLVSGGVPLKEKIIRSEGEAHSLCEGRELPQSEIYALCRCGKSKNAPFCDSEHEKTGFTGRETASREKYSVRAKLRVGKTVDMLDDGRCAYARFCHTDEGTVWDLIRDGESEEIKDLAVKAAGECLTGRLVAVSKSGEILEPELEPEINIIQDPERDTSSCIYVTGKIPVEADDGHVYELRNRLALCRCGRSKNKPFCDASHTAGAAYIDDVKSFPFLK